MKTSALSRMVAAEKARLKEEYDARFRRAFNFCEQWYFDLLQIAVAESMDLKPDQLKTVVDCFVDLRNEYCDFWNTDSPDCEYTLSKVDERLKEVCGPYFVPFEERFDMTDIGEWRKKWGE